MKYKLGQEVIIEVKTLFTTSVEIQKAKIINTNKDNIVVELEDKNQLTFFNNEIKIKRRQILYTLYFSKDQYEIEINYIKKKKSFKNFVVKNVNKLTVEQLETIREWIEKTN